MRGYGRPEGGSAGSETVGAGWVGAVWASAAFTWLLNQAFRQLVNNADLVAAYFDEPGVAGSGSCVLNRIVWDWVTVIPDDIENNAWTIPCLPYIWLSRDYLQALWNTYDKRDCGDDDGECACIVASLAATLVHEIHHTCCGGEKKATLLGYYYRVNLAARNGYTDCACCVHGEVSWDPKWYQDLDAVEAAVSRVQWDEEGGELQVVGCT